MKTRPTRWLGRYVKAVYALPLPRWICYRLMAAVVTPYTYALRLQLRAHRWVGLPDPAWAIEAEHYARREYVHNSPEKLSSSISKTNIHCQ